MKTTFTILVAFLTLQINFLFAGSDGTSFKTNAAVLSKSTITLAPATPAEATFEDVAASAGNSSLAPRTPGVASFDDEPGNTTILSLAPVTPAAADFEEFD